MEAGNVDDDIFGAEVARQPTPPVEVEADAVALRRLGQRGVGKRDLQGRIFGVRREKAVERGSQIVLRERAPKQRVLLLGIEVGVDNPPVDPARLLDVAERKIGRKLVEALRRSLQGEGASSLAGARV